ncbi:DinB family protein [Flavobacterium sp.]|uniref:DinB family protein n=1 Tax=Flavobacterium sp. TaxID=239 RepID=UPI00286D862F|nr:DinB family protein [Flavobacterium sp.]
MNFTSVNNTLNELKNVLNQLSDENYTKPIANLGNSSIGQHNRHIIELFQGLLLSYDSGILNYDNRARNNKIETNRDFANQTINAIICDLEKPNKNITLHQLLQEEIISIETNYFRELLYNLEHCIHHQALIKVALYEMNEVNIDKNFGVAPSTIEYKKQCAQ